MLFFQSCRLFYELSDDWCSVLNGSAVWDKFWFEGAMVMRGLSCDVIKVFP